MTRRDRSLGRRYGNRPERQRFLIYCEGEVTEKLYFQGIRRELRAGNVRIEIGRPRSDPYDLVRAAAEHQRNAPGRQEDKFEPYDQVWCVFDVEAPRPHATLDAALRYADKHGVRCAVSNPCFELWLLLHFGDQDGYLTTDEACRRLTSCECGYHHRIKQLDYDSIRHRRGDAVARAARLDQGYPEVTVVPDRNPWTSAHVLVKELFTAA